MKQILTSIFVCIAFFAMSQSPVVISEIMYNPPESGNDSLEYIEIYNPNTTAINVGGYYFSQGIIDTFPSPTNIPAGGYFVVAKSATAMNTIFNINVRQWTSGSLSNTGELIELKNATGVRVDTVNYSRSAPWDSIANGTGPSLELCNWMLDNALPSSWKASTKATGKIINGKEIKGTPGAANVVTCGNPPNDTSYVTVQNFTFTPADITINVGKTVKWTNNGGFHNINGSQAVYPSNPESFGNGGASNMAWTFSKTFTIAGFYTYQCDPHAGSGMIGHVTVLPNTPPPTIYPIASISAISTNNANGVVDSLNKKFEIRGIVYGVNLRASATGLQFTLIDTLNNGIAIFKNNNTFGYSVKEGDKIIVRGQIQQPRGLIEMVPDTILPVVSTNNSLFSPTVVTSLTEATESQLVRINNLTLLNPSQWSNAGAGFVLDVTNGTQNFKMRIDNDVNIFGTAPPPGRFNAIGIGSQNDTVAPFDKGYFFLPRYKADIILIDSTPTITNYPFYSIAQVTGTNTTTGVADSLDVPCELRATVYGVNLRASTIGSQFFIGDGTKGIGVFSSAKTFNYTVTEKDKIVVRGRIGQFNGFTQIVADTIFKVSANNPLVTPTNVTQLGENTESQLVKIPTILYLVNPAQWTTGTGNGGFTVQATDGTNVYPIRIDNDVDLYNAASPGTNSFRVTGMGSQSDNSSPYTSGYQLMPRYAADLDIITVTNDAYLEDKIRIYPNPTQGDLIINTDIIFSKILVYNVLGQEVANFSPQNTQLKLDTSKYPNGIYKMTFLKDEKSFTTTFVKQ